MLFCDFLVVCEDSSVPIPWGRDQSQRWVSKLRPGNETSLSGGCVNAEPGGTPPVSVAGVLNSVLTGLPGRPDQSQWWLCSIKYLYLRGETSLRGRCAQLSQDLFHYVIQAPNSWLIIDLLHSS
jgi:hypothetical protein